MSLLHTLALVVEVERSQTFVLKVPYHGISDYALLRNRYQIDSYSGSST